MDKEIREFLEYLELERGHSLLTIRNYESYLLKFAEFAKESETKSADKINLELIKKWRLALHRRGLSAKTLNYYMIAIRSFLKYLSKMDIKSLSPEKIELADTPERKINFLEESELARVLEAYRGGDIKELRDRAIVETLFSTGIRVSELTGLNRDDINLKRGEFSVLGKGGGRRVVFLSERAGQALGRYLEKRHDRLAPLFVRCTHKGKQILGDDAAKSAKKGKLPDEGRLTPRQIERIAQAAGKRAGVVKRVTPHTLRHSMATDMLRAGADLRSVQSLLGHSSVTTTQIYTHVTDKHLKEVHQRFHGKKKL